MRSLFLAVLGIFRPVHEDDPPPEELRMGLDAFRGKPEKLSPEEGIAQMTKRIEYLMAEQKKLHEKVNQLSPLVDESPLQQELARLDRELSDATVRLAEYKTMKDGRN